MTHSQFTHCVSCGADLSTKRTHSESYSVSQGSAEQGLPLCDFCLLSPRAMKMAHIHETVISHAELSQAHKIALINAMVDNRINRYKNLLGVVVCIVILEFKENEWFDLLLIRRRERKERKQPDLALVGGFMEEWHKTPAGSAKAEIFEEANIVIREDGVEPFIWRSNPRHSLLLNALVVPPSAIVEVGAFEPDSEVYAREVFRVTKDSKPKLCFPIHQDFLAQFSEQCFEKAKPRYLPW